MVLEEGDSVTPVESYFFVPWLSKLAEKGGVRAAITFGGGEGGRLSTCLSFVVCMSALTHVLYRVVAFRRASVMTLLSKYDVKFRKAKEGRRVGKERPTRHSTCGERAIGSIFRFFTASCIPGRDFRLFSFCFLFFWKSAMGSYSRREPRLLQVSRAGNVVASTLVAASNEWNQGICWSMIMFSTARV